MSYLCVMRHGQTDYNKQRRFQGHTDIALNAVGREQCMTLGKKLAESQHLHPAMASLHASLLNQHEGSQSERWSIMASDLTRCQQSLQRLLLGVSSQTPAAHGPRCSPKVHTTKHLREFHMGLFEGRTMQELEREHPQTIHNYFEAYNRNPKTTPYPADGESRACVVERLKPILETLGHQPHLVVGHGGSLAVLIQELTQQQKVERLDNAEMRLFAYTAEQESRQSKAGRWHEVTRLKVGHS